MTRLERAVMTLLGWILSVLIFVMMVDIFAGVVVRYVLHTSLNFSEELGRYVFVWIVFLGMARCIGSGRHVALDLLPRCLKGVKAKLLSGLTYLLCILFFFAVTWGGIALCELGARQKSATMRIPMSQIYLCIPLCGILCMFFLLFKFFRLFKKTNQPEKVPDNDLNPVLSAHKEEFL